MGRHRIGNMIGTSFGALIVLRLDSRDSSGHVKYMCKCSCGKTKVILGYNLRQGVTKSCGCGAARVKAEPKVREIG